MKRMLCRSNVKGKGRKFLPHVSSQVSTRYFTEASIQCIIAQATIVFGSPTAIFPTPAPNHVADPFHSGATISLVPHKKKAIVLDIFVTSSERSLSLLLIENVDMGELIEDLMKTKVPPPAYRRIQEFLIEVCMPFYCFIYFFYAVQHSFLFYFFFGVLFFRLERAVLVKTPSLRFTWALIYSLQMCSRTYACRVSWPHPRLFLSGTIDFSHILRFCLPSQMLTFMTMAYLSLHTSLILRSLN